MSAMECDFGNHAGTHWLPDGCDPEGWPDGLVFWSTSAARWMRVNGYQDDPL